MHQIDQLDINSRDDIDCHVNDCTSPESTRTSACVCFYFFHTNFLQFISKRSIVSSNAIYGFMALSYRDFLWRFPVP